MPKKKTENWSRSENGSSFFFLIWCDCHHHHGPTVPGTRSEYKYCFILPPCCKVLRPPYTTELKSQYLELESKIVENWLNNYPLFGQLSKIFDSSFRYRDLSLVVSWVRLLRQCHLWCSPNLKEENKEGRWRNKEGRLRKVSEEVVHHLMITDVKM